MRPTLVLLAAAACGRTTAMPVAVDASLDARASVDAGASLDGSGDAAPSSVTRPSCGGPFSSNPGACEALGLVTLADPRVRGSDGRAGPFAPGDRATITVEVTNGSKDLPYPCQGFDADVAGVVFAGARDASAPSSVGLVGPFVFAPGSVRTLSTTVDFGRSIPPGTVVHFRAWVDVLNAGCTNGAEVRFEVRLE
jgi:hypothetical protein